jgi:hypothetical protein
VSGDESDKPGFQDFYGLPRQGAWWPPRGLRYVPLRCCNRVRLDIGDSETAARLTAELQVDEIAERL